MGLRRPLPLLLAVATLFAHAAEGPTVKELVDRAREQGALNLLDLKAELRLTSKRKDGTEKVQELTAWSKRISGRLHSLARFTAPAGVKGVAVLSVEAEGQGPDQVMMYLPKLKRIRKVARSDSGQSFMNTDFSWADLGATAGLSESGFQRLADATVDGKRAHVLRADGGPDATYAVVTLFLDPASYAPVRVEYADRDGTVTKRYRALELKAFKGRTVAMKAIMENLKAGSSTLLEVTRLSESTLGDDAFTERALERG